MPRLNAWRSHHKTTLNVLDIKSCHTAIKSKAKRREYTERRTHKHKPSHGLSRRRRLPTSSATPVSIHPNGRPNCLPLSLHHGPLQRHAPTSNRRVLRPAATHARLSRPRSSARLRLRDRQQQLQAGHRIRALRPRRRLRQPLEADRRDTGAQESEEETRWLQMESESEEKRDGRLGVDYDGGQTQRTRSIRRCDESSEPQATASRGCGGGERSVQGEEESETGAGVVAAAVQSGGDGAGCVQFESED